MAKGTGGGAGGGGRGPGTVEPLERRLEKVTAQRIAAEKRFDRLAANDGTPQATLDKLSRRIRVLNEEENELFGKVG